MDFGDILGNNFDDINEENSNSQDIQDNDLLMFGLDQQEINML